MRGRSLNFIHKDRSKEICLIMGWGEYMIFLVDFFTFCVSEHVYLGDDKEPLRHCLRILEG